MNNKEKTIEKLTKAILLILQAAAFLTVWQKKYNVYLAKAYLFKGNALILLIFISILYLCYKSLGAFNSRVNNVYNLLVSHAVSNTVTDALMYIMFIFIFRKPTSIKKIIFIFVLNVAVSLVWIFLSKLVYKKTCRGRNCLLFYSTDDPEYIKDKFEQRKDQFIVKNAVSVQDIESFDKNELKNYDSVIIAYMPSDYRNEILKMCFEVGVEVIISPKVSDVLVRGARELNIIDQPLYVLSDSAMSIGEGIIKRIFDIAFSAFGLIVASPVMLLTALAIKIEDGGPVFYKQNRCTIGGREFKIIKFRSMIVNAEKNNKAQLASKNDSRITKVGAFIRATRIDELPQLINIIKGDMSVVGPRPERKELIDDYSKYVEAFPYRMKVKAGLTGYAQLFGKYNSNPYNKLLFDLMYVQKFSILLDFELILLTLKIVFIKESTEGVDEEFEAFIENFKRTNGLKENEFTEKEG